MAVKLAVVSGTALPLGIGRAIARSFIRNGFNILGVDNQAAEGLAAEDSHFNSNYIHHCCDVSSYDQVSEIWAAAAAALGGNGDLQLHCLVNNAALVYPVMAEGDPLVRYNIFKTVLDVNLTGPFLMCEALVPHMSPTGGSIINISSTRALMSEPNNEAYAASKAGLLGLTRALSQTLAGKVRVNAVLPGWIDTSAGADLSPTDHAWHAAGRVGVPEDVAEMCLFLAGPAAGFITGQEFVVDGGVTKKMIYPE